MPTYQNKGYTLLVFFFINCEINYLQKEQKLVLHFYMKTFERLGETRYKLGAFAVPKLVLPVIW